MSKIIYLNTFLRIIDHVCLISIEKFEICYIMYQNINQTL